MRTDFFRSTAFAPAFAEANLVALDIGSRGGFDPDLLPAAWAVSGIGFEPEPEAFAALGTLPTAPWKAVRWLPVAIGATTGPATLHVPADPTGASLLPHDTAIGEHFAMSHLTSGGHTVTVDTLTLDEAASRFILPAADYIKLDVEGAELDILRGAAQALESTLVIKLEAAFIPMRQNQPLVTDMEQWMRAHGFVLMDLLHPMRWRRGPVAPHPYIRRADPAYSRGQLVQCDLLFFRAPDTITEPKTAWRAALLAIAFGYFDHAAMLLERPGVAACAGSLDWSAALAATSRAYGRQACRLALKQRLRDLIPLVRSLLTGLPD